MASAAAVLRSALLALSFLAFVLPTVVAQSDATRRYHFANFGTFYEVQPDGSMEVEETITYRFTGTYHRAFRSIPRTGTDGITDILVIDADTGELLRQVGRQLDPLDPASWGAYTVFTEGGDTGVEWYFNASDTDRTWVIAYTVRGVVRFGEDIDELYWNVFSGLSAPTDRVEANVILPAPTIGYQAQWYRAGTATGTIERLADERFRFVAEGFAIGEPATIALGWDTGIVTREAYWRSIAPSIALRIVLPLLILLGASIWSWQYYRRAEGISGRVIIPQYAPPEGFTPAYAAQAVYGRVRPLDWAATVVHLATRGIVRIEEEPRLFTLSAEAKTVLKFAARCIIPLVVIFLLITSLSAETIALTNLPWEALVSIAALGAVVLFILISGFRNRKYKIVRIDSSTPLESFEQEFLDALIPPGTTTWTAAEAKERSQEILLALQSAREDVQLAFATRFKGYEQSLSTLKKWQGVFAILVLLGMVAVTLADDLGAVGYMVAALIALTYAPLLIAIVIASLIVVVTRFVLVRLSAHGEQLRDHLLGFKLYLQTAERYRLQGLTPEQFEKYLPYAMVFGVEKQWAKAFAGIAVATPTWYVGSGLSGASVAGFSAPAFASGFSASFASSFSSSAGGGASGGGGSAGGGGGGGGGGAS